MGSAQSREASTSSVAAGTQLLGRKQDRFMLARRENVCLCSVFDGHSPPGQGGGVEAAERAAAHFEGFLQDASVWSAISPASAEPAGVDLASAITAFFAEYQARLERSYDLEVRRPLLAERARVEAEINDSAPVEMPQEGGTTATVVVCSPTQTVCAWVGDSEAVLCRAELPASEEGGLSCCAPLLLTARKHQPSDEAEGRRAAERGGLVMNGVLYVAGAQGGLRVTRSLGDCALHAGGAVSAQPEVAAFARTPDDAFLVVASDGLWDGVSHARALEIAAAALRGCGKPGMRAALVAARQALLAEAVAAQTHPDDVAVVVAILNEEHALYKRSPRRRSGRWSMGSVRSSGSASAQ